jgi:hypothetical protein
LANYQVPLKRKVLGELPIQNLMVKSNKCNIHSQGMQKRESLRRCSQKPMRFRDEPDDISDSEKGPVFKRRCS